MSELSFDENLRRLGERQAAVLIEALLEHSVALPLATRVKSLVAVAKLRRYAGFVFPDLPAAALCDACAMEDANMEAARLSAPGMPLLCTSCWRYTDIPLGADD